MSQFEILPLSDFPGLVSVLKQQGDEYRRLKAAGIPLAPTWIIPASSWENVLRREGKQVMLRELMGQYSQHIHGQNLKLKNQIRRLITHLNLAQITPSIMAFYHRHLAKGNIGLTAVLPNGASLVTTPEKGDANFIATLLELWAKSCCLQAVKSSVITQLAPSIVINCTPSPLWTGQIFIRHQSALKNTAVLIKMISTDKKAKKIEVQLDSQTLQVLSRKNLTPHQSSWLHRILSLVTSHSTRRQGSYLRQLAHLGGKLGRLTAYPAYGEFVISKNQIYFTDVSLHGQNH